MGWQAGPKAKKKERKCARGESVLGTKGATQSIKFKSENMNEVKQIAFLSRNWNQENEYESSQL